MKKPILITSVLSLLSGLFLGYALSIGISKHREIQWINAAQNVVNAQPQDASKWVLLGNAKNFAGDYNGALLSYKKALQLTPDCIEALQGVGMDYLRQQDWKAAEEWFNKSLLVAEKSRPDAVYHTRQILEYIASQKHVE